MFCASLFMFDVSTTDIHTFDIFKGLNILRTLYEMR